MTDYSIQQHRASVAKAGLLGVILSVLLTGVAYAVASGTGRGLLAYDIAMAGGVLLLAGVPGLVLATVLTGKVRGGASIGFVGGIAVRLPVGGVLALYGLNWGLAKTASFSQLVATTYLVFLVIEVLCMSPAVKRTAAAEMNARKQEQAGSNDQEEPV